MSDDDPTLRAGFEEFRTTTGRVIQHHQARALRLAYYSGATTLFHLIVDAASDPDQMQTRLDAIAAELAAWMDEVSHL
jgi:hypothetical protein